MHEAEFIATLRTLPLHPGARGLSDDAAVIAIGGETLVVTHDMVAEGVHYLPGADPFDVAWKLVAVNLSDLAAKGAEPIGILIGASLTDGSARFLEGLRAILTEYDVPLLGGDTIRAAGPAGFGCTAIGRATTATVPARSGAQPGDTLYLAGEIGAARRGWLALTKGEQASEDDIAAYLRPRPLLAQGRTLAPRAHAMMDVSDGLLLDASRMAAASGVTIDIDAFADDQAMRWGDDYALLLAASPLDSALPPRAIGRVLPRQAHDVLVDGRPVAGPLGYQH
ncbi:thiamine-phosphate kinase [Sphingomonas sp.]|jgi:thiamine-monophosphate kinase|uniref:thiamine-phosphate kinase n=1 Tax=Sphingomonas sp. TaxID=28214 RepID=UPI002E33DF24|nr:thiamine-phosphate kinase [Sphingomonas sp.]HEX4694403.1 thiamine-phosphate kinase [Sphingomonas sp.]